MKDFVPPIEWSETDEDDENFTEDEKKNILYIRVLNTRNFDTTKNLINYSLAELKSVHKKGEINTVTLLIESSVSDELKGEELINRIINSFKREEKENILEIENRTSRQLGIKATFQVPKLIIYDLIIRDLP